MTRTTRTFTLLEVLTALAILAGAITATMYGMTGSARRVQRAERFRTESQQMANAVEFFLLYPPGESIDENFFPYKGMRAECRYEDPELPDDVEHVLGGQRLVKMSVEIIDDNRNIIAKLSIDRIIEADKL